MFSRFFCEKWFAGNAVKSTVLRMETTSFHQKVQNGIITLLSNISVFGLFSGMYICNSFLRIFLRHLELYFGSVRICELSESNTTSTDGDVLLSYVLFLTTIWLSNFDDACFCPFCALCMSNQCRTYFIVPAYVTRTLPLFLTKMRHTNFGDACLGP